MTGFEERYARLPAPARELLDAWLAADPTTRGTGPEITDPPEPAEPTTEAESLLVRIWRDVLERDDVGVEDDYLEMGGDSIRAIVVVARAEAAGLRFTTQDLVAVRTIRALAALAEPVPQPAAAEPAPRRQAAGARFPMSPLQQGLLSHTLAADRGVYVARIACDLVGDLDEAAFRSAWQSVVDRHDALRSTFHWAAGVPPYREVAEPGSVVVPWCVHPPAGSADEPEDGPPGTFDLGVAPLLRLTLIPRSGTDHRFVVDHHHLLLDGWSQHLVFTDVLDAYAALRAGRRPDVPDRSGDRRSAAHGQGVDPAAGELFWRTELAGFTGWPHASRAPRPSAVRTETAPAWPADVGAGLTDFCHRAGVMIATVVQATWALLLARSRAQDDIVVGVTVSGRAGGGAELLEAVGMFINTVPLRVRVRTANDLAEWLSGVQRARWASEPFEAGSLVDIARHVDVPAGRALFDSVVVVENFPGSRSGPRPPDGLRIERISATIDEDSPLVLQVGPEPAPTLLLRHDPAHTPAADARRLVEALVDALAALASAPPRTVGELLGRVDAAAHARTAQRTAALNAAAGHALARSVRVPLTGKD